MIDHDYRNMVLTVQEVNFFFGIMIQNALEKNGFYDSECGRMQVILFVVFMSFLPFVWQ